MNEESPTPASSEPEEHLVRLVCPECSELLEIRDIQALVLSLHLRDKCEATEGIFPR